MAKSLLTPKDLADAVGVSESSMRRWIDSGRLKMTRTAGGHRRIERAEAVRFIRETGTPLVRGEILGLGGVASLSRSIAGIDDQLFGALVAGDRDLARDLVVSWHFSGRPLAAIFDGPFRAALERLGELWLCERGGILIEHRATDICIEIIHQLYALLPTPPADAPLAMGFTPGDEWHSLPSQMAAVIAREGGLRDINYGANAPIELLAREAARQKARLVWLSMTMPPRRTLRADVRGLADALAEHHIELIVGGRHAPSLSRHSNITALGSMSEFAAHVAGLRNSKAA